VPTGLTQTRRPIPIRSATISIATTTMKTAKHKQIALTIVLVVNLLLGATVTLLAYGYNQWCEALPTEYIGQCGTIDWQSAEPPCAYACLGNVTRRAYSNVGVCKAKESKTCSQATQNGTYVEAVGECVPPSGCSGCYVASYGPDGPEQSYGNTVCNP
jgi:hypothetical protein